MSMTTFSLTSNRTRRTYTNLRTYYVCIKNKMKDYGSIDLRRSDAERGENESNSDRRVGGLSIFTATLFVAGEMAGSGVLALPKAIVDTGYIGIALLLIFSFNAAYSGVRLGNCWNIVEQRFPEHRADTRNPYPIIALKAVGLKCSVIVSRCIRITLFGAGTVYLLLSAQIIRGLLNEFIPALTSCAYFLIVSLSIIPAMWLSSPKEFRIVGLGAIVTTITACVLFFIQIVYDAEVKLNMPKSKHGFNDFFLSFGTILFAFGGASTFPTIQNDMNDKKGFSTSVSVAFILIMILYVPITIGGFLVYGENVDMNLTTSLSKNWLVDIGNILMALHLVFAFLIVMNTVCQDVEESYNIPKEFGWKRCVVRTLLMILVIMAGETVPQFGKILSFVGGSTITMLTFVFPPYFYMKLCDQKNPEWESRNIPLYERVYLWELIFIGLVGGCASTFSAFSAIFGLGNSSFTKPCYWPS